jgi:hypothetical protein
LLQSTTHAGRRVIRSASIDLFQGQQKWRDAIRGSRPFRKERVVVGKPTPGTPDYGESYRRLNDFACIETSKQQITYGLLGRETSQLLNGFAWLPTSCR